MAAFGKWLEGISIHAPVKGATRKASVLVTWDAKISIHAPVKGATPESIFSSLAASFQSTHP